MWPVVEKINELEEGYQSLSDDELIAGDVVTLEPGLYVEGIGGMRIEHNYLITQTGAEQLSNHLISLT